MQNTELKPWNASYSVGIKMLDDDHRILISMINKLHQAMIAGKSHSIIAPLIKELQEYTVHHFHNEESHLKKINSPDLEEQKQQHSIFAKRIEEFSSDLENGNIVLAMKIMPFLNDWLLKHIMNTDMNYSTK